MKKQKKSNQRDRSMAESLKKYFKDESLKDVLKELQYERRNSDRI